MPNTKAYAAFSATEDLKPFEFDRRRLDPKGVQIEIDYCGICHSDIHIAHNDWGISAYPIVPGHEIIVRVKSVGNEVVRFAVGDSVAVGCMVDSCGGAVRARKTWSNIVRRV